MAALNYDTFLSDEQAITTGTVSSTNVYQLINPQNLGPRDIGEGEPLYVRVTVDETFDQVATTLGIEIWITPAANGDLTDVDAMKLATIDVAGAYLRKGAALYLPIPSMSMARSIVQNVPAFPLQAQFLGLRYVVTGTAFAAGKVTASLTRDQSAGTGGGVVTILGSMIHGMKLYPSAKQ